MAFYDLSKEQREVLVARVNHQILADLQSIQDRDYILQYFSDEDTNIRKTAYLAIGRIWKREEALRHIIIAVLEELFRSVKEKVRQTTINAAGEIGIHQFDQVVHFFDRGLFDAHQIVRNAVIGSVKKMGEKNPLPVLEWARQYLHHSDKEIRREICHGMELRGRTHPQDILPLLRQLEFDKTARVKNTLVHVLGQIAYKKGCLATVVADLRSWENKELVLKALDEIIDVHNRYKDFAILSQQEAIDYIQLNYLDLI